MPGGPSLGNDPEVAREDGSMERTAQDMFDKRRFPRVRSFLNHPEAHVPPSTQQRICYVILAVVLATVLLGVLFNDHPDFIREKWRTPVMTLSSNQTDGNFTLTVASIDSNSTNLSLVNWILLYPNGTAVPGEQGGVHYIIDTNRNDIYPNATFRDNDRDYNFTVGDQFKFRGVGNGGEADVGYRLLLKFERTGESMNGGGTVFE